jgi:hypothetical protein
MMGLLAIEGQLLQALESPLQAERCQLVNRPKSALPRTVANALLFFERANPKESTPTYNAYHQNLDAVWRLNFSVMDLGDHSAAYRLIEVAIAALQDIQIGGEFVRLQSIAYVPAATQQGAWAYSLAFLVRIKDAR